MQTNIFHNTKLNSIFSFYPILNPTVLDFPNIS